MVCIFHIWKRSFRGTCLREEDVRATLLATVIFQRCTYESRRTNSAVQCLILLRLLIWGCGPSQSATLSRLRCPAYPRSRRRHKD